MSTVQGFGGLLAARIFLGVVEAIFFPGALYFMSLFYNRKQYALRVAILFGGSQLGNAFGTLFAIGVLRLDGTYGLAGWRWVSDPFAWLVTRLLGKLVVSQIAFS